MRNNRCCYPHPVIGDLGPEPLVFNINHATNMNQNFRTTLWTGCHMQLTLMCIPVGGDIGLEIHRDVDQFIRIENGCAKVYMGRHKHDIIPYTRRPSILSAQCTGPGRTQNTKNTKTI